MKHSRFGLILLLSSGGLLSCNGDPTSSIRDNGPNQIIADPKVIYLDKGETTFLTLQLVDQQGGTLPATFEAVSQNANATVELDTTFLATTNGSHLETGQRFSISGIDYVETSIKVTSGSDTLTVPVSVVPKTTIAATFSDTVPVLGETVTVTAPAGITFSPTSTVTFAAPALPPAEVAVAPDGLSISFVPPPNLTAAPATITDVVSVGSPNLTFTNATATGITTPVVVDLPATIAPSFTPAANQAVTVTLNAATSLPPSDTTLASVAVGTFPGIVLSRTPTTISFLPTPDAVGPVTVAGVFLDALPQFELTLSTPDTMTVGPVTTIANTGSTGTAPLQFTAPALGNAAAFFDTGVFTGADITGDGGLGAQYYKFTVSTAGDYHFITNWAGGADIDAIVCNDAACSTITFAGSGITQPEDGVVTLAPGTYYFAVVLFAGTAPASFSMQVTNEPPVAP
jgi:hypothetical protein